MNSALVTLLYVLLSLVGLFLFLWTLLAFWVIGRYGHWIVRIFEEKPMFLTHQAQPHPDAEEVVFETKSGRKLVGSYLKHTGRQRLGVLLLCHEFLCNRWTCLRYAGHLREVGFDLFTFDFGDTGDSDPIEGYDPLQWVTNYEKEDVRAAVRYLESREDRDPRGIGAFGVSKGGGAIIAAAADERAIRAVCTDGAFPTHLTVTHYISRWAEIVVTMKTFYNNLPIFFFATLTELLMLRMRFRRSVQYLRLERAIAKFGSRPLLIIHGKRDNYINPWIVERFFEFARDPKELWFVKGAKHNGCLDQEPEVYRSKIRDFFVKALAPGGADPTASSKQQDASSPSPVAGP
ncbi:Alpha/beta hydrolase family protein [Planctomycetes bacterium Pan216]|uniref:Alpha/beta hydrolase family protein n=1 Tax=Kolteria novifilia TaxID=2527975 RepID=A0A518BAF0_9BACT|nr:Alpha/beta hydrolase family protein [Planctomycetes bacterium Pan216]